MSAPGIGKHPHLSLSDLSAITRLPKPLRAIVYLVVLSVLTVAGISALIATAAIIGQLTGAFDVLALVGQ